MIQSDKFDSSDMKIKQISNTILQFVIKRLVEIFGIIVFFIGILLFVSLITYSPNDPNFIFPENTEISNLLGYQGSYSADLFLQSIGLISYLVSLTLIFTGINIFRNKDFFLIIENTFLIILYSISGSIFLNFFYNKVGVILSNLCSNKRIQQSLISNIERSNLDESNEIKVMNLIDKVNKKFGYGKLRLSSDTVGSFYNKNKKQINWFMKSNYRSPCYTTKWCDIPKVKVWKMNESEQKKIASSIVLQARAKCRKEKINPYIAIGAFIDEVIRELSTQNSDDKISEFLINIAGKVKSGIYRKDK